MVDIIQACVEIRGTRPLLFNKFGPDSIPLTKRERSGVAGNDPENGKDGSVGRKTDSSA